MDQSVRSYTTVPKSNSLRASQLAPTTHQSDPHEQHARQVTAHEHSTTNPHRKMLAHLGTIPDRLVVTVPPNHTVNSAITQHVYSQPYVVLHSGKKTRRTVTSLQVGFVPATKTFLSHITYSEMFCTVGTSGLETYSTNVTVDNTSITYAYLACYLIQTDPFNVWSMANGPHEHFTVPRFETISPVLPLKARWCHVTPTPFNGVNYTAEWYSTNSNIWPLRPGPSRARGQIVPLFVPPYTEPTAYYTAHSETDGPAMCLFFRTSPTIMQSWMPFTNGANLGIMFSGYLLRCGNELAQIVTPVTVTPPTGQPAPWHTMEFVQGPGKYSRPLAVYGIGAGHNHIETHLVLDEGDSLLLVPSLKPIFTRGPAQPSFDISTLFAGNFDPIFTGSITSDVSGFVAGPIPADGSFQLMAPLNAAPQQAALADSNGTVTPWIMTDTSTIPQVVTGFTLSLCEYPLADPADILVQRCGNPDIADICQTRSELLPGGTYPSLAIQALYFDG